MSFVDKVEKIRALVASAPPEKRLAALKLFLSEEDEETARLLEFMVLTGAPVSAEPKHFIVLIHGIRTNAEWQQHLEHELRKHSDIEIVPTSYGVLPTWKFLYPVFTRTKPVLELERELRTIRADNPAANISILAHSFGTYVVSRILQRNPTIRIHRLQLCGSIIREKYRWDRVKHMVTGKLIVNDVGTRDNWPVLAKHATVGYGDSGRFGFKTYGVRDNWHDLDHSGFFSEEHMKKFWVPFLIDGQIVSSDWATKIPKASFFIKAVRIFWPMFFSLAALYVFWKFFLS